MTIEEKLIKDIVEFSIINKRQPIAVIMHKKDFKQLIKTTNSGSHKQKGKPFYMGTPVIRTKDIHVGGIITI